MIDQIQKYADEHKSVIDQRGNQDHRAVGELVAEMKMEPGFWVLISSCHSAAVILKYCSGQGWVEAAFQAV